MINAFKELIQEEVEKAVEKAKEEIRAQAQAETEKAKEEIRAQAQAETEKAREENRKQTIRSYFIEGGDDNAFIAKVMHTSLEYVQNVRNEMVNTPLQV